jgi:hypothetical protein
VGYTAAVQMRSPIEHASRRMPSAGPVAMLAAVLVAVQAAVVFGVRVAETRPVFNPAELAPSLELYGDRVLSQTFLAHADGLTAITVYPVRRAGPVAGPVEVTLEVEGQAPIARASVPAADVVAGPEWTWTFPPVAASAMRRFRLRVALPRAAEGSGLSLAIGPPTYGDGALHVGVRPQWGDLRFETRSEHSRVIDLLQRRPAVRRGAWVTVAALAAMLVLAASLSALTLGLIGDRAAE